MANREVWDAIAGAGLDVWEEEPPPHDHRLMAFDNVLVSPHTAGATHESRDNMARTNAPGRAPIAYSGYAELSLGGKRLALHEFRGHTKGDTVITLPAARTVIAGDLVTTPETIPTIVNYADGGNWTELGQSLDAIAKMDFDVLIAGHGPNLTKAEFIRYRDRTTAIRERFRALNRERKTQEEIAQTLVQEFNWGTGPAAGNLAGMMQELR